MRHESPSSMCVRACAPVSPWLRYLFAFGVWLSLGPMSASIAAPQAGDANRTRPAVKKADTPKKPVVSPSVVTGRGVEGRSQGSTQKGAPKALPKVGGVSSGSGDETPRDTGQTATDSEPLSATETAGITAGPTATPPVSAEPAENAPSSQRPPRVNSDDGTAKVIGSILVGTNLMAISALAVLLWRGRADLGEHARAIVALDNQIGQLRRSLQEVTRQYVSDHQRIDEALGTINNLAERQTAIEKARVVERAPPSPATARPGVAVEQTVPAPAAPFEMALAEFCGERIDHHALISAAQSRGLRWGSGRSKQVGNAISIEFSNSDNRILAVQARRGHSEYYLVIKDGVSWSLDLAMLFERPDGEERVAGQAARVRTRKAGRGTLQGTTEIVVTELGIVDLYPD